MHMNKFFKFLFHLQGHSGAPFVLSTLALGNITGAMVFQSTVIPAIGIALTPWKLTPLALTSALLAVAAAGFVLYCLKTTGQIKPRTLAYNGVLYGIFLATLAFAF